MLIRPIRLRADIACVTREALAPTIAAMGSLSRSQLLVYGAVAVALLLVGARWIARPTPAGAPAGGVSYSSGSSAPAPRDSAGSFGVDRGRRGRGRRRRRRGRRARASTGCRRARGSTTRSSGPAAPPRGPNVEAINLAARLADGQQVVVPAGSPARPGSPRRAARRGLRRATGPISLGTATVEELDTIEGIGPVTAQNIVEFRDQHGGVSSVDELDQITGIGPATMERCAPGCSPERRGAGAGAVGGSPWRLRRAGPAATAGAGALRRGRRRGAGLGRGRCWRGRRARRARSRRRAPRRRPRVGPGSSWLALGRAGRGGCRAGRRARFGWRRSTRGAFDGPSGGRRPCAGS